MSNATTTKSLAKVLVAAAWADGAITTAEINSLKDLLFHLPGMTAKDWDEINIYVESPVDQAERQRLIAELQAKLASPTDRAEVLQALEQMVQADGSISEAEQAVVEEIKAALQNGNAAPAHRWNLLTRNRVEQRTQAVQNAPNREIHMDDFVKNKIFYHVSQRLPAVDAAAHIPESDLRKLSLAGGLLARVAYVDRLVTDAEYQEIVNALQTAWGISLAAAGVVAEVAVSEIGKDLDYYRLSRQFFESTSEEERVRFLDTLFAVTISDGHATEEEIEEIRAIANGLLLSHQQFIAAKLKVPRNLRTND
jgi:uncharacterized tellurite resistance protein B-like protein